MADPFHQESIYLTEEKAKELVDTSWDSPFHTIGSGSTQAAAGNHAHEEYLEPDDLVQGANIVIEPQPDGKVKISGSAGGAGATDHGALTGLLDDDHTQYLNNGRGDGRYSKLGHGHSEYSLSSHNHSAAYAAKSHTHTAAQSNVRGGVTGSVTLGAGDVGSATFAHGCGEKPTVVVVTASDDTGSHSIVLSIASWDASNISVLARNLGTASESFKINWMAIVP